MGIGVGVDPGADSIKIVQVRAGAEGVSVLSALTVRRGPGGGFPAAEVAERMARAGIARRATLGVTGRDVMIRYLPVPAASPSRLKKLIEFEIRENMARGARDISADYRPLNLPTGLHEGLTVLAALAKNEYLEDMFGSARLAGVRVRAATPAAVALFRCFAASREYKPDETTLLMDLGRENTEIVVQRDGELYFARNTSGGGEKLTQDIAGVLGLDRDRAEGYKRERARLTLQPPAGGDERQQGVYRALLAAGDAVVSTVQGGIRFCRTQTKLKDLDFDRLVLSGGGAKLAGLREFLLNRLKKPVTVFDPAAALDGFRLTGADGDQVGGATCELAVAAGLAVCDAEPEGFCISLLPPREAARRLFWRKTAFAYASAALAALLAAAMFVRAHSDLSAADAERRGLAQGLEELRGRAAGVGEMEAAVARAGGDVALLLDEARVNRAILEFLRLAREACPEGLKLTRLETTDAPGGPASAIVPTGPDAGGVAVRLEGTGGGDGFLQKMKDFEKRLGASPIASAVSIGEFKPPGQGQGAAVRMFRCDVLLRPWGGGPKARGPVTNPAPPSPDGLPAAPSRPTETGPLEAEGGAP